MKGKLWVSLFILAYMVCMSKEYVLEGQNGLNRVRRSIIISDPAQLWPGNTVYYSHANNHLGIQSGYRKIFKELEARSCIKFRRSGASSRNFHVEIGVQRGRGCWSKIGYSRKFMQGSSQPLNIEPPGCVLMGTMRHELMHALGFFHEIARPDRDNFISVYLNNVQNNQRYNFDIQQRRTINDFGRPYDLASIMHYAFNTMGLNRRSTAIRTKDPSKEIYINPRSNPDFSFSDLYVLNKAYKCNSHCQGSCNGYFDNSCRCVTPNDPVFATWPPRRQNKVPSSIIDEVRRGRARTRDVTRSYSEQGGVRVLEVVGRNAFLVVLTQNQLPTDLFLGEVYLDSSYRDVLNRRSYQRSITDAHFRTWWVFYDPNFQTNSRPSGHV